MPRIIIKLDKILAKHELNQKELADSLDSNRQRIGRLFHGQINQVPLDLLGQIADKFEITDISQLIDFEEVTEI